MADLLRPFRFEIGPYSLLLPEDAEISAEVAKPPAWAVQKAWTNWTVSLGRFLLFIHLDPLQDPVQLGSFIESCTKQRVETRPIAVNGLRGESFGDYGPPRTWIDWWFKRGELMICLCLQSKSFPVTEPTREEAEEHHAIIGSIRYEAVGEVRAK